MSQLARKANGVLVEQQLSMSQQRVLVANKANVCLGALIRVGPAGQGGGKAPSGALGPALGSPVQS